MISNSEFEKLWVLYKTEGEPKGVSINEFCVSGGVNYREFNKYLLVAVSCFGAVFSIDKDVYEKTVAKSINR